MEIENFRRPLSAFDDPSGPLKHSQNVSSLGFLKAERSCRKPIFLISR